MNTINLVFIQFYNMQSLYECLEEKTTLSLENTE